MFGMKVASFAVICVMISSEVFQLASGQNPPRRGSEGRRGSESDFGRNVGRLHRVSTYEARRNRDKYVSFDSGTGRRGNGAFYPYAKRSVETVQEAVREDNILVADLKCATLEACLGGTEAPLQYALQMSTLMNSIDYLLQPAFRVGFYGRSKDHCRRIYADCEDENSTTLENDFKL